MPAILPASLALISATLGQATVTEARHLKLEGLKLLASQHGLRYPFGDVFLRAYKREKMLEVWVANSPTRPHVKIVSYPIAAASGELGPKRRSGDGQVPEGFYPIDRFNPYSRFLLSMRVGYPNKSDKLLGDRRSLGNDIYIHGNRLSIGCLAITDDKIRELYTLCLDSFKTFRRSPHILMLPYHSGILVRDWPPQDALLWTQLYAISRRFDRTKVVPHIAIDSTGAYRIPAE